MNPSKNLVKINIFMVLGGALFLSHGSLAMPLKADVIIPEKNMYATSLGYTVSTDGSAWHVTPEETLETHRVEPAHIGQDLRSLDDVSLKSFLDQGHKIKVGFSSAGFGLEPMMGLAGGGGDDVVAFFGNTFLGALTGFFAGGPVGAIAGAAIGGATSVANSVKHPQGKRHIAVRYSSVHGAEGPVSIYNARECTCDESQKERTNISVSLSKKTRRT